MAGAEEQASAVDEPRPTTRHGSALAGAAFLVYWIAAIAFGAIHIHGAGWPQGGAPLSSDLEGRVLSATGLVESWQFFERDLRADQIFVLRKEGGVLHTVAPVANGEPANLFGIGRRARKDAVERNRLTALVGSDAWSRCGGDLDACVEANAKTVAIENPAPAPAYCGSLVLVRKSPVAWAYASAPHPPQSVSVVRVEVKC